MFIGYFVTFCTFNTVSLILLIRAGFRRGQSGQLPRGPHKKAPPPQISIMFLLIILSIVYLYGINQGKYVHFQSSLARIHRYYRLFGVVGNFLFKMPY